MFKVLVSNSVLCFSLKFESSHPVFYEGLTCFQMMAGQQQIAPTINQLNLGGGFNYFLFSSLLVEDSHFD